MKRLNGWQRLGVVLSVLWVVVGVPVLRTTNESFARHEQTKSFVSCHGSLEFCESASDLTYHIYADPVGWDTLLGQAFVPIVLAWLGLYFLKWIVAWVARGGFPIVSLRKT